MGDSQPTDAQARGSLQRIQSAAVPDVTDTSYQAQLAALGEYAQSAFNEVLAQYRFLGLLAGIKGPNDTDQDVTDARNGIIEALEEFLRAGPLAEQVESNYAAAQASKNALQERIFEGLRGGSDDVDGLMDAQSFLDQIWDGHPHNQSEGYLEGLASGAYDAAYAERVARLPEEFRSDFESLIAQQRTIAGLEDARRAARRQAVVDWFKGVWDSVANYYHENMELIRNGQWLLATGRIAIDAAIFAAEEIVIAAIVAAIVGLTGGLAAGMALALRGAVRMALSVVRQGTRVVRKVRATYVFKIELRKIEPGVLYSNPIPITATVRRRLDYDKTIDVEHDLTDAERQAVGEGGQGSTQTDADATEQGTNGNNETATDGGYRHPRDGDTPRSRETLAPNNEIPGVDGFADWWDDLSPAELEDLLSDRLLKRKIGDAIRNTGPNRGGEHEWLKVSQQLTHKRLGFTMREIQDWVTATRDARGPLPVPDRHGNTTWRHRTEDGKAPGSHPMHKGLDELYAPPTPRTRNELLTRMGYFANHYLENGIDSLPSGLRNAIIAAGGG